MTKLLKKQIIEFLQRMKERTDEAEWENKDLFNLILPRLYFENVVLINYDKSRY